jgi:gas vesicle protein
MGSGGFMKGMAAGLLLGACAAMIVDPVSDKQKRKMQKKTEGVFRNIGNIIDSAISIMH